MDIIDYLKNFSLTAEPDSKGSEAGTAVFNGLSVPVFTNEFWTSKQRQAKPIHEVSYRACFKPQLPGFFINLLTQPGDTVYDPFLGRGTTLIEAALRNRNIIGNDINPLSIILTQPRLFVPQLSEVESRLHEIAFSENLRAEMDLSMFYHPKTESELVSLRRYIEKREQNGTLDTVDRWIRMVATNRLTGHSVNFFSGYTLPPNQAISPKKQKILNQRRGLKPPYKDVKQIILKKSADLMRKLTPDEVQLLRNAGEKARFINNDARSTDSIADSSIQLTVTSPPFLDVVQYADDNWLRCWFNRIDIERVSKQITMANTVAAWQDVMLGVFRQLYRITRNGGYIAFEVGEVRNGTIKLEEHVVPLGTKVGLTPIAIVINRQNFTKTANIWGVKNNRKGTNSNRIVLFKK